MTRPHARQVREAARLISESRRPVLYVGGGVIKARAAAQLRELAELTGIPVVTTLMARGAFPDRHPQHMGMPGMHGTVAAVGALQKADLLVALGTRFDDRVTGKLDTFAPGALIVHADIDPAEISKNRHADVPIVGDCREVIADLVAAVQAEHEQGHRADLTAWRAQLNSVREHLPAGLRPAGRRHAGAAVRDRADRQDRRAGGGVRGRRRPAPDVGGPVHRLREPGHLDQLGRPRHDGLRRARRDGRQGRAARTSPCGPSTATAASR